MYSYNNKLIYINHSFAVDSNDNSFPMLIFFIRVEATCTPLEMVILLKATCPQPHKFVSL